MLNNTLEMSEIWRRLHPVGVLGWRSRMHRIIQRLLALAPLALSGLFVANVSIAAEVQDQRHPISVIRLYGPCGPQNALRSVADAWERKNRSTVKIVCGPAPTWTAKAQLDGDIIWGTSEQSMTAILASFPSIKLENVQPIYLRQAIIAVKKGNPRNIQRFEDLLRPGIRIVVTDGSSAANTSGTGIWEDIAGRLGRLEDVQRFRRNIIEFSTGSGASLKAFRALQADAWITWPEWAVDYPDELQAILLSPERKIWRDLSIVISPSASSQARAFAEFVVSNEAQRLMRKSGYVR